MLLNKLTEKFIWGWLIVLGLVLVFLIPPFQKPDEVVQFYKSVAIARGDFFCYDSGSGYGHKIPKYLEDFPANLMTDHVATRGGGKMVPIQNYLQGLKQKEVDRSLVIEKSPCTINPFFYLISGAALAIPVNLGLNPFIVFYVGRLANFTLALILIFIAIKLAPLKYKTLIYFIAILPMTINQISAYNKDVWHIGFGLIMLSIYLDSQIEKNSVSVNKLKLLLVSVFVVIASRWQYLPIVILLWGVHFEKLWTKNLKMNLVYLTGVAGLLIFTAMFVSNNIYILTNFPYLKYVYPKEQLNLIIRSPSFFGEAVWQSFAKGGMLYGKSLFGVLGWMDLELQPIVYLGLFSILILIVYETSKHICLSTVEILKIFLTVASVTIIELGSFYIYWTPVGSDFITGIQGRYFIILLPLIILLSAAIIKKLGKKTMVGVAIIFGLVLISESIYRRYFDFANFYYTDKNYVNETRNVAKNEYILSIDQTKKLTGVSVRLTNSGNITVPYLFELKDRDCIKTIARKIISADNLNDDSVDITFHNYSINKTEVCIKVQALFESENNSVVTKPILSPIYRY